jgi:Autotransporter beta-domain
MKFKRVAVASALILSSLSNAHSAAYTYSLTWTGGGGTINGEVVFNTLTLPSGVSGGVNSLPASITSGWFTLGGTTWSTVSGSANLVTGMYLRTTAGLTLDITSSSNIVSSLGDLNFFTSSLTTGCGGGSITTPNGISAKVLQDCANSVAYTLTSVTYGSSLVSSVNLAPNAYALRSVYNIQSASLNAGLSYDCTVFDKEGLCISTGGRYSTTNAPYATSTSGLLIGSYKYDKNIRLGAWVDQNLSTNNADGVKLGNSKPLLGIFGVWSESNDGLGYEVKVSAGYGEKDITVTRTADYQGSAKVNTKGLQSVSSYGIALDSDWIAAPYAGLKYVSISRGGYTEGGSSPLTYDTLRQETTSVIAGVKFTGKIDAQTFTVLSAGVEHDLNHNVGQYSAGSSNTTAFNSDVKKTRPVISAGVYYDIDKTQRVGLNATHRQEAFQSTATTSALATYTVGF